MLRYVLKRLLLAVPIFICITLVVFCLSNMAPGSPVDILASNANMSEEQVQELKEAYGLDKPIIVRYGKWLADLGQGDLGMSVKTNQPAAKVIGERIGPSLVLSLTSLVISVIIGVMLGIVSAHRPYSVWDKLSSAIAFLGNSVPSFFVALLLIYLLAVKAKVLPASGMWGSGEHTLGNLASHLFLPCLVISVQSIGGFIKQTRGSMLECINEDYVKTARSKGISELRITICHVLRNAWIPIVTQIGFSIPYVIGGAVVTEQIFGWPGIGSLMVASINGRDYNVIMGITVMIAVVVLLTNIVLDVIYAYLDPRISAES